MDLVIVGAQKAGTTWLFSMIKQQPRVGFAFQKEIHYFDRVCRKNFSFEKRKKTILSGQWVSTEGKTKAYKDYIEYVLDPNNAYTDEWYKNIFLKKPKNRQLMRKGGDIVFMEASPSYMAMPERGFMHMAKLLPDIEPVLIVRDPVRRMISGTSMWVRRVQGRRKSVEDNDIIGHIDAGQVLRGKYSRSIPLLKKYFKGVNVVSFKDIIVRPEDILRNIEIKYGLDEMEYKNIREKNNSKSGKVVLSDKVKKHIATVCEPEYDYIKSEFGADFLKDISNESAGS